MKGLGWDEVDVRINLGRYDRILLIDTGVAAVPDEEILSFYDLVQVPIEIEPVNLEYFNNLINQILDYLHVLNLVLKKSKPSARGKKSSSGLTTSPKKLVDSFMAKKKTVEPTRYMYRRFL
jgi:hypothetical protein